ncbi:hypothetical protein [Methylocystis heyeri]|uniref:Uncharacterized protein n=1 Tax=Methylocystis heyeri TaxID=391905 RepID=A0A6B8KBT6_9HYPH|nr:hypothetical protein [Methylocystis heyeri]QGM45137.1 hypothetical protein H2LOC_005210 [Methylocystis heyeri]
MWLCDSAINRHVVQRLWAGKTLPPDHLTIFVATGASREECFLSILETVDQHHPSWKQLLAIGAPVASAIASRLAEYGAGVLNETADGFIFDRS